jgi:retron-type reverse transcriptase
MLGVTISVASAVMVLNAIYEEDFLGFSYGFRPGRGPHDALDACRAARDRGDREGALLSLC